MSVTIQPVPPLGQNFTTRRVERPCLACAGGWCQPGWCEDGVEVEETDDVPRANLANVNARGVLRVLGLETPYLDGELLPGEVRPVLERCRVAMTCTPEGLVARAGMLAPTILSGDVVIAGTTDADAINRFARVCEVLAWASEHGCGVRWS